MKKSLLFGASAAAMLIATPALAQVELTISGGIEFEAGYANEDAPAGVTDIDDFDFQTEAFITFTGEATADNGLTYGTRIDLDDIETDGTGVAVDEVSIFLSGGWGVMSLGDDDGAADNFETDPPTVGNGQVDGSFQDYIVTGLATSYGTTNTGDSTKIYYASPSFSGFQVGFSYTPENDAGDQVTMETGNIDANNGGVNTPNFEDVFEAGLLYDGEIGGFSLRASGTLLAGDNDVGAGAGADDLFAYQLGVRGGTGPFMVGLQYWDNGESLSATQDDQYGINVAGTYSVGAWAFGLGYSYAETDPVGPGGETEDQAAGIGFGYAVAPGLSVGADLVYFDQDAGATDTDGWVAVTSLSASF